MIDIPKIEVGIDNKMRAAEYHAIRWAASASQLRTLHASTPAHLYRQLTQPFEVTPEMVFGELVHRRILEPELPLPAVAVVPDTYVVPDTVKPSKKGPNPGEEVDWNWRTNYCKEWKKQKQADGFVVLTKEELAEIQDCAWKVKEHPEARELIEGADTEVSLFWETECGFPCKARLDLVPSGQFLADIKTTRDASPRAFQKMAFDSGYHLQAKFYMDAWEALGDRPVNGFKFIAYEKEIGLVTVHTCSPALLAEGRRAYMESLDTYIRCVRHNEWPGYPQQTNEWDLPKWFGKISS